MTQLPSTTGHLHLRLPGTTVLAPPQPLGLCSEATSEDSLTPGRGDGTYSQDRFSPAIWGSLPSAEMFLEGVPETSNCLQPDRAQARCHLSSKGKRVTAQGCPLSPPAPRCISSPAMAQGASVTDTAPPRPDSAQAGKVGSWASRTSVQEGAPRWRV